MSLFSGYYHSSEISDSVQKSPRSRIAAVSLPNGEKASSVACGTDSVIVLSSNGRIFESPVTEGSSALKFSEVFDLSACQAQTATFLAVNKEGRFFCRGSNGCGQLGLGEGKGSVLSF